MSANPKPGDQATVTAVVAVGQAAAFDVFTRETDLWWRRGPAHRVAGRLTGTILFEPKEGGRLFEKFEDENGPRVHEYGRIRVWQPPSRLVFEWRNANFAHGESTEVEVLFEAVGDKTRITLTHRGWSTLRPDHPARHGEETAAFLRTTGLWWASILSALREHAAK